MFELNDRVALVTGGSRGIGRACAEALAGAGAFVVVNYRSGEAAAAETVAAIEAAGGHAEAMGFDVSVMEDVAQAVDAIVKQHGRLDILVSNAGIAIDQLLLRVKPEEVARTFATNVEGAIWCAKAAIRPMMRKRWGRIIHLSSVVGETGNPGQAVYAASKAALIGLTKTLAREYASRGVTVNAVAPGYIETDMTDALNEEVRQAIVDQTPLGRVGRPEEIAAAVLYLASQEAGYVTGQVLRVNGGMYI
ncbi:3-oxoacyl-[acyl-carrier-protein] reductase [bacterium]|nr:3-oxoacyl-[acyl-carrier-protein] reductase [bacterium]NCQ60984.1 3-oxoacyl-[acyl-carrier-protein] reductase [Myxococcales bacterium]